MPSASRAPKDADWWGGTLFVFFRNVETYREKLERRRRKSAEERRTLLALHEACTRGKPELRRFLAARNALVVANLRLVISIAKKFCRGNLPIEELLNEGNLGLMHAAEKFDNRKDLKFSTYAVWWIRQAITRALVDKGRLIRLPVNVFEKRKKVRRAADALAGCGEEVAPERIAERLKMDTEKVKRLLRVVEEPISLDAPPPGAEDEEEVSRLRIMADHDVPSPFDVLCRTSLREKLEKMLTALPPRNREIMRLRFGLKDGRPWKLEEIGRRYHITREGVRRVEVRSLERLRRTAMNTTQFHALRAFL
jgi:RNA polymerase primary sigma factor